MQQSTGLRAPSWATSHEETEGGIRWEHEVTVQILPISTLPDFLPSTFGITAFINDTLTVGEDGAISLVRDDVIHVYAGDGEQLMTTAQARILADALLDFVNTIEGASR